MFSFESLQGSLASGYVSAHSNSRLEDHYVTLSFVLRQTIQYQIAAGAKDWQPGAYVHTHPPFHVAWVQRLATNLHYFGPCHPDLTPTSQNHVKMIPSRRVL
jgi:hypothetical protein